jgi:hypothetical protein
MVKYNQQKQKKEAQIKPYEKMLLDNQNKYDTDVKGDKIEDKLLEDERGTDGAKGDKIYEKLQEDVRTGSPDKNTEGQLNEGSTKYNDAEHRSDGGEPLMDYHKKTENEEIADFTKANSGMKRDKMFWDKYVNSQIPPKGGNESLNELTKIVDNDQSSQLLSNYDTREEMREATPAVKSASADLKDADAILYHIYREAAENGRELTDQEKQATEEINSYKTNTLVELQKEAVYFPPGGEQMPTSPNGDINWAYFREQKKKEKALKDKIKRGPPKKGEEDECEPGSRKNPCRGPNVK